MIQIINEIISVLISFVLGVFVFRYMSPFFRLIFFQLSVWMVFYFFSYLITGYQKANGLEMNNQWFMNIHIYIESTLLHCAAFFAFTSKTIKRLSLLSFTLFTAIYVTQIYFNGFSLFLNYADVAEGICITFLYMLLLYNFFMHRNEHWWMVPEIILCIGILLYFACSVPYIAMLHYLQTHYPEENNILFRFINDVLANVRYLFVGISFWLLRRNNILLKRDR